MLGELKSNRKRWDDLGISNGRKPGSSLGVGQKQSEPRIGIIWRELEPWRDEAQWGRDSLRYSSWPPVRLPLVDCLQKPVYREGHLEMLAHRAHSVQHKRSSREYDKKITSNQQNCFNPFSYDIQDYFCISR